MTTETEIKQYDHIRELLIKSGDMGIRYAATVIQHAMQIPDYDKGGKHHTIIETKAVALAVIAAMEKTHE